MQFYSRLEFSSLANDSSELLCPRCKGYKLQSTGVTVYHRGEDENTVTKVQVTTGPVTTVTPYASGVGNPSRRRQGIAIQFKCEQCDWEDKPGTAIELTIAQHKGNTVVGWHFDTPADALG
jgi:hypothetical protein